MSKYGIIKCHSTFGQPSGITVELANEDAKKYSEDTDKTTHFVYNYTICSQVWYLSSSTKAECMKSVSPDQNVKTAEVVFHYKLSPNGHVKNEMVKLLI